MFDTDDVFTSSNGEEHVLRLVPIDEDGKTIKNELTINQLESIEFTQIGDPFPKRLEHIEIPNGMYNINGHIRIGSNYYKWKFIY